MEPKFISFYLYRKLLTKRLHGSALVAICKRSPLPQIWRKLDMMRIGVDINETVGFHPAWNLTGNCRQAASPYFFGQSV